jgi:MFS transporter, NNP family, nitrate/nitrite transporter
MTFGSVSAFLARRVQCPLLIIPTHAGVRANNESGTCTMHVSDLFRFKNPEIRALHLTWIAFFICFYVWFNMAPLASSMLRAADWLTRDDIRLFAIANVALTIPARIIVGMALDRFGPRRVFSVLMVSDGDPGPRLRLRRHTRAAVHLAPRALLDRRELRGRHPHDALWFKPRDIGFAEGSMPAGATSARRRGA